MTTETGESQSIGLREQLELASKEVAERAEAQEQAPSEQEQQAAPEGEQERDESGRFKPKEGEGAPEAAAEAAPEGEEAAAAPEAKPDVQAPTAWSPAAKAKFGELPPEIQQEITKREAEIHKGFTQQDEQRTLGKTFQQVLAPYAQEFAAQGRQPVQEVANMLALDRFLKTAPTEQKVAAIHDIARVYGVDLANAEPPAALDPQVAQLQAEFQQLKGMTLAQQQQAQQRAQQEIVTTLHAFASNPEHKHYEAVRTDMAAMLESGVAKDLKDAYDRACWANPTIRSMLQQEAEQAREAKRIEEARRKAAAAKKAGSSVSGGPGGGAAPTPAAGGRDLRSELKAQMDAALGRV